MDDVDPSTLYPRDYEGAFAGRLNSERAMLSLRRLPESLAIANGKR